VNKDAKRNLRHKKRKKRLNMAAEHKGNMGAIFYFPIFCNFYQKGYIPQLRN